MEVETVINMGIDIFICNWIKINSSDYKLNSWFKNKSLDLNLIHQIKN